MSRRRPRCLQKGKKCYRDKQQALNVVRRMQRLMEAGHVVPQRAYYCPHCGKWHITSQEAYEYQEPGTPRDKRTTKTNKGFRRITENE